MGVSVFNTSNSRLHFCKDGEQQNKVEDLYREFY